MKEPLYTVTTYDADSGDYTPQEGLSVPSQNVNILGVRRVLRELKREGFECHRWDSAVLVERTH